MKEGSVNGVNFRVYPRQNKRYRRLRLDQAMFAVSFDVSRQARNRNQPLRLRDYFEAVGQSIQAVVDFLRERYAAAPHAQLRLSILARGISALNARTVPIDQEDVVDDLMDRLSNLLESKTEIPLDEAFEVHSTVVDIPPIAVGANDCPFLEPQLSKKGREAFLMFPPEYKGRLENCCLLISLVLGLSYNAEMRAVHRLKRSKVGNPVSAEWKILKPLTNSHAQGKKGEKAREYLKRTVLEFCVAHGLTPDDFSMTDLESLRPVIDRLGINVKVFAAEAGDQLTFYHPFVHDATKETVSLYLVEHRINHTLHAGLIKRLSLFLGKTNAVPCEFCRKSFSAKYVKFHICTRREVCKLCRHIVAEEDDYMDYDVARRRCLSKISDSSDSFECEKCDKVCLTKKCLEEHKKCCAKLEHCDKCKTVYRIKKDHVHTCGETFCRSCHSFYNKYDATRHVCRMTAPGKQKKYSKIVCWDLETIRREDGSHRPNCVGVSYETSPGVFNEICYYDEDMRHPQSGVLEEAVLTFRYWPERLDEKALLATAPKRIRNKKNVAGGARVTPQKRNRRQELMHAHEEASPFIADEAAEAPGEGDDRSGDEDDFLDITELHERAAGNEEEGEVDWRGSALDAFVDRFLTAEFFGATFIAHNSGKFDSILLLKVLIHKNISVQPIFSGNKLLLIKVPPLRLRFVDSYMYIKTALRKFHERFPDMPGGSVLKGDFPYKANVPSFYTYRGPVPDREYFVDEFTTPERVRDIDAYLKEMEGKVWDFKDEVHRYLLQDVRVLRGGVLCYLVEMFELQEELSQGGKLDSDKPFHAFTAPFFTSSSFVHSVWRRYSMGDNIYLVENQRNARKTSTGEREWLAYESKRTGINYRTAFNHSEGQKIIKRFSFDGFDERTKSVLEYNGCVVHGHSIEHPDCRLCKGMRPADKNPYGRTLEDVHRQWERKKAIILKAGLSLSVMWECVWEAKKKSDPDVQEFLEEFYAEGRPKERLALRDALRGGRTESYCLLYDVNKTPDRVLSYIDKNSLYPHCAIKELFPVGRQEFYIDTKLGSVEIHPQHGFFDKSRGKKLLGDVQITILAPDSMFLPLLPLTIDGKLLFGLCRTCLENTTKDFCTHSDRERELTGTWTTIEIEKAIAVGYKVVKIHEISAYLEQMPIFKDFYLMLARQKIESEGWPKKEDESALTQAEKEEHVSRLNAAMPGLNLRVDRVKRNWPRRQSAKEISNASLGKFSQDYMRESHSYVTSWLELSALKYGSDTELLNVTPITESLAEAAYTSREDRLGYHRNTQVFFSIKLSRTSEIHACCNVQA